jgi:phosphoglycerate dehydrogenase-like enzyme
VQANAFQVAVAHDGPLAMEDLGWRFGVGAVAELPEGSVRLLGERSTLAPADVEGVHALIVLTPNLPLGRDFVEQTPDLAVIARFGVGFDRIDTAACTEHGVAVAITPAGPYKAVASGNVALLLSLAHRVSLKESILRDGGWAEAGAHLGIGLPGKTLGSVGLGRIARETFRLIAPFGMRHVAFDPFVTQESAGDVELVELNELAAQSDFIVVNCALNDDTRGLLGADFFAHVKPGARLVNLARGPIVDEPALVEAVKAGAIGAIGLDVFETEPLPADSPLRELEEAIIAPHSLAATDELVVGNGSGVLEAVRAVAAGEAPADLANPDVRASERLAERLARTPRAAF